MSSEGFAAVKVTALGDPQLLERVSSAVTALRNFFHSLDSSGRGTLDRATFVSGWTAAFDATTEASASQRR